MEWLPPDAVGTINGKKVTANHYYTAPINAHSPSQEKLISI